MDIQKNQNKFIIQKQQQQKTKDGLSNTSESIK